MDVRRFRIAGLDIALHAPAGTCALAASYDVCALAEEPADWAPALELWCICEPGFARGRARTPAYPAFDVRVTEPRRLALSRFDAEGELELPASADEPVRARFRVGESVNSLEAALRIGLSVAAPRRARLLLHASAVHVPALAGALLFAGKSGAGKSTIAAVLDRVDGFTRLADELLIVAPAPAPAPAPAAAGWELHVPPFLGGVELPVGARVPLVGAHVLAQAPAHERTRLRPAEAVRALLPHVLVYVAEPETAAHVLAAAADLVAAVPGYHLAFAPEPSVAEVLLVPPSA
ncbi:hypothetical protein [Haliangium ochraceum]|uniref:HPr kinase n=1 Tax=Haliangium ochraceum (strain DSM 14365 / JCM 11303 / SMP-2) TaxID=502025 RepID=D0LK50_HALO1|nr:hypothetical protein [Haliangium ochraceum]ACY13084.1 hypothetical protein Hoch_0443 [Haliangium ochraceum DSM 14365]